jgi:hypothetical protein
MTVRRAALRGRWRPLGGLLLASLVAAGCGSSTPTVTPTTAPSEPAAATGAASEPVPTDAMSEAPSETPEDTGTAGTPACPIDALKASHGITEVDGDDRTTEVVLVAADTCSVDAYPTLQLVDSDGAVLVSAAPLGVGGLDLVGGVAYTSEVRLGNWCLPDPTYPVTIAIVLAGRGVAVTGDSFPDDMTIPPCVHEGDDPVLSGTAWLPAP